MSSQAKVREALGGGPVKPGVGRAPILHRIESV